MIFSAMRAASLAFGTVVLIISWWRSAETRLLLLARRGRGARARRGRRGSPEQRVAVRAGTLQLAHLEAVLHVVVAVTGGVELVVVAESTFGSDPKYAGKSKCHKNGGKL
jgi:hypothetical protein